MHDEGLLEKEGGLRPSTFESRPAGDGDLDLMSRRQGLDANKR